MNKENKSNESIPQGGQQIIINQVEKNQTVLVQQDLYWL